MRVSVFVMILVLVACGGDDVDDIYDPIADAPVIGIDGDNTGAALCERSGLFFCEDFEARTLGPVTTATSPTWDPDTAGSSLFIDATHTRGAREDHGDERVIHVSSGGDGPRVEMASGGRMYGDSEASASPDQGTTGS